jgi:hypothetical protein
MRYNMGSDGLQRELQKEKSFQRRAQKTWGGKDKGSVSLCDLPAACFCVILFGRVPQENQSQRKTEGASGYGNKKRTYENYKAADQFAGSGCRAEGDGGEVDRACGKGESG